MVYKRVSRMRTALPRWMATLILRARKYQARLGPYKQKVILTCAADGQVPYILGTSVRMKRLIRNMDFELVRSAIAKIKSVEHFRDIHYRTTPYQVGNIICTVRNLFAEIVHLYKQVKVNDVYVNEELLDKFEEVHNKWYTIEHLIRTIEEWEERKTDKLRRNGPLFAGVEESKRWDILEEGERLEEVQRKSSSAAGAKVKKKMKWHASNKYLNPSGVG